MSDATTQTATAAAHVPGREASLSPASYARIAGAGYLIIIAAGIFAEFFVRSSLIVRGDAATTAANIAAGESLFRTGMAADLVMLIADVVVAIALYAIFERVSRPLALLAAFLRLVHAAVYAGVLLNLHLAVSLVGSASAAAANGAGPLDALALVFLDAHAYGYALALVFFAVHCLVLGHLVRRSRFVPPLLGALLMVAGIGYLIDSFGRTLLTDYAAVENVLALVVFLPAFIGELSFCLWLLIKGVDVRPARTLPAT